MFSPFLVSFFTGIVVVNIALAIFNLVPIPPLDGHHILFAALGNRFQELQSFLSRYSFIVLIIFIIYGWELIEPIIMGLVRLFIA